jgi:hypothetical protein
MSDPKPSAIPRSMAVGEAVQKFHDSSMERMAAANKSDEPIEPLFHYTSQDALFSIVQSEQFRFTSIYHMDDTEELMFGFGIERKLLQEAIATGDDLTRMFCEELADETEVEKLKEIFEFYSVSFGMKDDAKQWDKYAQGGLGISFGLVPSFFTPLMNSTPKPEEMIFLGKVVYGEAQARARHSPVINEAIDTIKQTQQSGSIKDGKEAQLVFQHIAAEMRVETLWNSVTTKDSSWSHQNETRLLAMNNLKAPLLKIHNAPARPRVELPQPLLKKCITEVMIGPNADAGAEGRVRAFLDSHGLSHVPVTHSTCPKSTNYYDHRCHQFIRR